MGLFWEIISSSGCLGWGIMLACGLGGVVIMAWSCRGRGVMLAWWSRGGGGVMLAWCSRGGGGGGGVMLVWCSRGGGGGGVMLAFRFLGGGVKLTGNGCGIELF